MFELIKELKYNQKINEEKGLENKIDIDYVIKRLENIEKQKKETLEKKLEDAIDYFVEYTPIEELKEHIDWYNAEDICDLKDIMYESYLDSYEGKELENRINALYKIGE